MFYCFWFAVARFLQIGCTCTHTLLTTCIPTHPIPTQRSHPRHVTQSHVSIAVHSEGSLMGIKVYEHKFAAEVHVQTVSDC